MRIEIPHGGRRRAQGEGGLIGRLSVFAVGATLTIVLLCAWPPKGVAASSNSNNASRGEMTTYVHMMDWEVTAAATATLGLVPELDRQLVAQIGADMQPYSDEETQSILNAHSLVVNDDGATEVADVLLTYGTFFSPRLRALIEELEPGVHRYFEINVISKVPLGGKTNHGTYYWLRPPPLMDCLLFPETNTIADAQGVPWSKDETTRMWGGGPARSKPGYVDKSIVNGRHFWRTKTGAHHTSWFYTWSDELYQLYRKAGMRGWQSEKSFEAITR